MNLPQIDLASLPGIEAAMGIYGSAVSQATGNGDVIIAIMVYVYETTTTTQSLL